MAMNTSPTGSELEGAADETLIQLGTEVVGLNLGRNPFLHLV